MSDSITQQPEALPTIPVPKPDLTSLCASVVAMKQVVEGMLRGAKPLGGRRRPAMFVQTEQPINGMQEGDFWLCAGQKTTLNVYVGAAWHTTGTLV